MVVLKVLFYAVIMIAVFGVLIFIHELGHFLTARWAGVTVKEFALGMGPKLLSWKSKKSETRYSIRLFPIGGYVSMDGEDEESENSGAFCNQKVYKRMIIVVAGATMNLLLGLVLTMSVVLMSPNIASNVYAGHDIVQAKEFQEYLAENPEIKEAFDKFDLSAFPLKKGDKIISVDGTLVFSGSEARYEIMNKGYKPIDVTVRRNGEKIKLEDVTFPAYTDKKSNTQFAFVEFMQYGIEAKTPLNVIRQTVTRSVSSVKMIYDSLFGMITGRFGMDAISGPIGVAEVVGDAWSISPVVFINVVSILTINLGVVNLLPIPALDGGRFVFLAIEGIRKKPISRKVEGYVNFIGIIVLFGFMILISFKDVFKLIFR